MHYFTRNHWCPFQDIVKLQLYIKITVMKDINHLTISSKSSKMLDYTSNCLSYILFFCIYMCPYIFLFKDLHIYFVISDIYIYSAKSTCIFVKRNLVLFIWYPFIELNEYWIKVHLFMQNFLYRIKVCKGLLRCHD